MGTIGKIIKNGADKAVIEGARSRHARHIRLAGIDLRCTVGPIDLRCTIGLISQLVRQLALSHRALEENDAHKSAQRRAQRSAQPVLTRHLHCPTQHQLHAGQHSPHPLLKVPSLACKCLQACPLCTCPHPACKFSPSTQHAHPACNFSLQPLA